MNKPIAAWAAIHVPRHVAQKAMEALMSNGDPELDSMVHALTLALSRTAYVIIVDKAKENK